MRFRIPAVLVVVAMLRAPTAEKAPNVLLITLDTTRADRMGFLGSSRGLTPALDALARQATVFTAAYAQAPVTTVSHATILTGTFPPFHHVSGFGAPLPGSVPYLPDLLRQRGYRTAAFVGSLVLDPRAGTAPGFERGFDRYDAGFRSRRRGEDRYQTLERRGEDVAARARQWIAEPDARPWFAWVHLYDPHDPYNPPADLQKRFASSPYDGEIAAVDRAAGGLLQAAGGDVVIAVAADHGEALGDHGEQTHGVFLYDEVLHVPMLLRLPDRLGAGVRVNQRVRLADLTPTLLEAARVPVPPAVQGESLLPLIRQHLDAGRGSAARGAASRNGAAAGAATEALRQGAVPDRPAYAETDYPRQAFGWSMLASWRQDRFLLVRAPRPELYDLVADPGAMHNLAASRPRVVEGMAGELEQFVRRSASGGAGGDTDAGRSRAGDQALAERLAALGYVGGAGSTAVMRGTDPKDEIEIANALHTAIVAVDDGELAKAIPLLEHVVTVEPAIPIAQFHLGVARARERQYARAIPPLKQAVALQPDLVMAQYELGLALYETGDLAHAAAAFEAVVARMPRWADAHYSLASVAARIDRVDQAVAALGIALDLEPRHFHANLLLGRILTLQNQATAGLRFLKAAADVEPASAEAHSFLADAYEKAGMRTDAARERLRARELTKPGR
jgi:arylsulfatase A-like enzyme/cytochrome c-type biogenesis protein CcmH/NrfG